MSRLPHGGPRVKNARETYVEQLPQGHGLTPYMNKRRKPFTHLNSVDAIDLAYQSTPDYLRQLAHHDSAVPTELALARTIPRTKSASEMTPRNTVNRSVVGKPNYKTQEDYYDEIQALKKEIKAVKEDNSSLRARNRRLEEDNARKAKEIDALYDPNKDGDLRRTLTGPSTDRNNNATAAGVVMSLKQRVFKLESQLKQKETTIEEMKSDPKWTRSTEYEKQNRALMSELTREKVSRMNSTQQNNYMATLDEAQKDAVRKLHHEKDELKTENENLKKRVDELKGGDPHGHSSARTTGHADDRNLQLQLDKLERERGHYENEIEQMKDDLKDVRRQRNEYRDKLDQAKEELEQVTRERDDLRKKFGRGDDHFDHRVRGTDKVNGRSSPSPRHSAALPGGVVSALVARPRTPSPSPKRFQRRGSNSSDEFSMGRNKSPPKTSARNSRQRIWTVDDDRRVESFRQRHAATVIQRGWREHDRTRRKQPRDLAKMRQDNLDKWDSRIGKGAKPSAPTSPRSSTHSVRPGSALSRDRPAPASNANESAVRTVQASLRGHMNRNEFGKGQGSSASLQNRPQSSTPTRKQPTIDSDDDDLMMPAKKDFRKPSALDNHFSDAPKPSPRGSALHDKLGSGLRDSQIKRGDSPPAYGPRPQSSALGRFGGSKQDMFDEHRPLGSGAHTPKTDRYPADKMHRPLSPLVGLDRVGSPTSRASRDLDRDSFSDQKKLGTGRRTPEHDREAGATMHHSPSSHRRSSSPHAIGTKSSKESLNDRNQFGSGGRARPNDRDVAPAKPRASSPMDDLRDPRRHSPESLRFSARRTPNNSKPSIKEVREYDDDNDVM